MWINNPERVRTIMRSLSDEYSMKIIAATIDRAKSPEEISSEQHIPVSSCYRRIHQLASLSMIRVARVAITDGKKILRYKSLYKDILVRFESNILSVELVPNCAAYDTGDMQGNMQDGSHVTSSTNIVIADCDLCQSKDVCCKVFVAGDSKSCLNVCKSCEKKMIATNIIKTVENSIHERRALPPSF